MVLLSVVALPVLLMVAALAIDAGNLFAQKRSAQNAADASALAIVNKNLDPYGAGCMPAGGFANCNAVVQYYSPGNNTGPSVACGGGNPSCYTLQTPYNGIATKVKVTINKRVPSFFAGVASIFGGIGPFDASASAVASVKPCSPGAGSCYPLFAYAMSTACDAIQIHGPNSDPTGGGNVFPGLWTNGGISATSPNNTAQALLFGNPPPACSLPSPGDLSGPTSYPLQRPCTSASNCIWPTPLPDLAGLRATCASQGHSSNASLTVGANWTVANLPGVYCVPANKSITINGNNLSLIGYTFVGGDITLNNSLDGTDAFGCSGTPPCTVFYADGGDVHMNSIPGSWQGDIFAPGAFDNHNPPRLSGGAVSYSGGTSAIFDGLIEAQTITINAKQTTFTGAGVGVGGTPVVSLEE